MTICIKNARAVVTCDDEDRVLRGADILLDGGRIAAIGRWEGGADETIDGRGLAVFPGLVNTHHHLYQYFTRNLTRVQGFELFDWLTALYEIWKNLNEDTVRLSSLCGMAELMKYGCTTCFDHHYVFPKGAGGRL
ncbi:MAG: amidohydrolase family protein, partial [Clostridia bacterium]|nr:amidohydrolase family protein [Clostridia bacterium]